MSLIAVIQGVAVKRSLDAAGMEVVDFLADADEDNDGIDSDPSDGINNNPEHDPCHQSDTTLHGPDGRPLDPYKVPYIVVPPAIIERTRGIVLGSHVELYNITNGQHCFAVVGDVGPHTKIGELSPAAAKLLGLHITAFNGESRHIIRYVIHVGRPAIINGVAYRLQPWRS